MPKMKKPGETYHKDEFQAVQSSLTLLKAHANNTEAFHSRSQRHYQSGNKATRPTKTPPARLSLPLSEHSFNYFQLLHFHCTLQARSFFPQTTLKIKKKSQSRQDVDQVSTGSVLRPSPIASSIKREEHLESTALTIVHSTESARSPARRSSSTLNPTIK